MAQVTTSKASHVASAVCLTRRRSVMCSEVGDKRGEQVRVVEELMPEIGLHEMWKDIDRNGDRLLDRAELREALLQHDEKLLGGKVTPPEVDLLMCYLDVTDEGSAEFHELETGLTLWHLFRNNWKEWEEQLGGDTIITTASVWRLLYSLNEPHKVALHEAEWVLEMTDSFCPSPDLRKPALGLSIAFWMMSQAAPARTGIHRERFIERLEIERRLELGVLRLLNIVIMSLLLTEAFQITGQSKRCRGIKDTLVDQYQLGQIAEITSLDGIRSYAREFSKASQDLAVLSSSYFHDGSEWSLVQGEREFQKPERLPVLDLLIGEAFTLQAWVKLDYSWRDSVSQAPGIPLLRKVLSDDQVGSRLSCWRWSFPPSLSFGAHDFGGGVPRPEMVGSYRRDRLEEYVYVPYPETREGYEELRSHVLHTVIVNRTHAKFMNFSNVLGIVPLRRPVTDCSSKIITIGDEGVTLAEVRFWPRALNDNEVRDIITGGATMMEVGHNVPPLKMERLSDVELISLDVADNKKQIIGNGDKQKQTIDAAATLVPPAVLSPQEELESYSNYDIQVPMVTSDPTLGYPYWQIYDKPVYTDSSSKNAWLQSQVPPLTDSGFTISAWIKFKGSGYFMAESYPQVEDDGKISWAGWSSMCWYIWLGDGTNIKFRQRTAAESAAQGLPEWTHAYKIQDHEAPEAWKFNNKVYRHFIFRVDPKNTSHPLLACLDGVCGGDHHINEVGFNDTYTNCNDRDYVKDNPDPVAKQKVMDNIRVYMNRRPADAWHLTGYQMSVKYFNRSLTDSEILELFEKDPDPEDPQGRSIYKVRGCMKLEDMSDDPKFEDDFGHNCYWYFTSRLSGSKVCEKNPSALRKCPIACQSVEICWGSRGYSGFTMQIWEQQMEFRSKGPWGTVCVGKSSTAEKEAIRCGLNAPYHPEECKAAGQTHCGPKDCTAFEGDSAKIVECLGDLTWVLKSKTNTDPNLPCADIIRLHEPTCDWDDSGLDHLSPEMQKTGQWTGQFWFEAMKEGCIQPQLRLINGWGHTFNFIGPIHPVVWAAQPEADRPLGTGCADTKYLSSTYMGGKEMGYMELGGGADLDEDVLVSPGMRHLLTFGARKDFKEIGLQMNTESDFDSAAGELGLDFEGRGFLRIINVIGDIRMSPWNLSAHYPTSGEITKRWYDEQVLQARKVGPARPLGQQLRMRRKRAMSRFSRKTTLVTPPLIMLVRRKAGTCALKFSDKVIAQYVANGNSFHCSSPYECETELTPSGIYSCPAEEDEQTEPFFGLMPEAFQNRFVYVELLSTIADHAILVRKEDPRDAGGTPVIMETSDFMDTQAREVEISAMFYSIEFGITSDLRLHFDTGGGRVHGEWDITHYVAASGSDLQKFLVVTGIASVTWITLFVDTIWGVTEVRQEFREKHTLDFSMTLGLTLNALVLFLTIILGFFVVPYRISSGDKTEELIGQVVLLPWDGNDAYGDKKERFLRIFEQVAELVQGFEQIELYGMAISVLLLLRMVLATGIHPRISLMTATLKESGSEIFHFMLIFFILFWNFSRIANWRYGASADMFSTDWMAMATQFDSILDPPGQLTVADQGHASDYVVFALLFHVICFFFLVNFILAIIVNAYGNVIKQIEICEVEQNIMSDIGSLVLTSMRRAKHRWPQRVTLIAHLEKLESMYVNPVDLEKCHGYGSWKDAQDHFDFYTRFSFLYDPDNLHNHGHTKHDEVAALPALHDLAGNMHLNSRKVDQVNRKVDQFKLELAHQVGDMKKRVQIVDRRLDTLDDGVQSILKQITNLTNLLTASSSDTNNNSPNEVFPEVSYPLRSSI